MVSEKRSRWRGKRVDDTSLERTPKATPEERGLSVAADLEAQAAEAERIRKVQHQELLADPATNPATRAKLEALREYQHNRALDLQRLAIDTEQDGRQQELTTRAELHRLGLQATLDSRVRAARRSRNSQDAADRIADRQQTAADRSAENAARVQEARRESAERSLYAVQQVREDAQAAKRVTGLRADRSRFVKASMSGSVLLSVASAYGMGLVAGVTGLAAPAGWVLEMAFTGLSVMAITYRSQLQALGGTLTKNQNRALWALFAGPLLASVAVTGLTAFLLPDAPVGLVLSAAAAVGAAVLGLFAYLATEISSAAIKAANAEVTDQILEDLVTAASGPQVGPPTIAVETLAPLEFEDRGQGLEELKQSSVDLPTLLGGPTESKKDTDSDEGLLALLGDQATRDRVIDLIAQMGSAALDQQGASPSDQHMPQGASPNASGDASPDASPEASDEADEEGSELEQIWSNSDLDGPTRLTAWIRDRHARNEERAAQGLPFEDVSVRGAARDLEVNPRTVRRWRDEQEQTEEQQRVISALHSTP